MNKKLSYKTNRTLRRVCSLGLFLLLFLGSAGAVIADSETLNVRVGYFEFSGYHEQDERGVKSGYGYELLAHLAGYANLRYEYVGYNCSWSEMQDMLASGEIDLLSSAQKTPERAARFDFTDSSIGVSSAILTVKAGDERYMDADYSDWDGIRVGMLRGNSRNQSFSDYAAEHGFVYTPVYFESTCEMLAELKSDSEKRSVDAVLTSDLRAISDEWILAKFAASPFYLMVQKGNSELLSRLNSGLSQLESAEPGLYTQLMNKYYTPESGEEIAFSHEERAFIEEKESVTFSALVNPDSAPYSWYENGVPTGILVDAANTIISRSGLDIKLIICDSRSDYWDSVAAESYDIRFDMVASYNHAETLDCWLSPPYVRVAMARLAARDTTVFERAAEPLNLDITDNYERTLQGRELTVSYYDSVAQTISAIKERDADCAYLPIDSAIYAVNCDVTNQLVSEEVFGETISYALAVSRNQSPLLYSILCKSAASLTEADIADIRSNYIDNLEKPFSLLGYLYRYPLTVFVGAVVIACIVILVVIMVSQNKQRKSELEHLRKEQENNELLRAALNSAEAAGIAKSQFLSRVSHEMRTPLNAIIGFIELSKNADAEQTRNYIASSELAAKQLLSVINDVLDMSSIESGKLKIANAPFNFRRLVSSVTNIYGTQCKQRGIGFETRLTSPLDDCLIGDELRINQILMNLLGNAVKFTDSGNITLTVSETASDAERIYLRFVIADTGCGMGDDMLNRLFKPFEQESASTARRYGGSGLGLSIVKNLVSMMDGSVRAESELGKGSSFIVDLPFLRCENKNVPKVSKEIDSLRVLVVDDEAAERMYISTVLDRLHVRMSSVKSGSEALSELARAESEADPYNVCLIDWRMPELNGVDTTRLIRQKYGDDVIVIVASAFDFQQARDSAVEAGANVFLSKPIFQSSLFDLLMDLTGGVFVDNSEDEPQNWDFSGARVLLCEDNALNQIVAKGYLDKLNMVVEIAENGGVAVEKFVKSEAGYYAAILMDIQMPVMDGFAATKAIRESAHPDAKKIPIIAQSADAFNEDVSKAISAGMNAHIAKPIKLEILARMLYKALY